MNHKFFLIFSIILVSVFSYSQEEESNSQIDVLRPSKAAFYSAVLPGLGQIYNKKAWKVPIVYAAIGISGYSYDFNGSELRNTKGVFEISISYKFDSFFGNRGPNPCECM